MWMIPSELTQAMGAMASGFKAAGTGRARRRPERCGQPEVAGS